CAVGIRYVSAPPSFEGAGQKVRMPEQVIGERLATCLDLTLVYAAVLEHIGLQPLLVIQNGHAFVGVWLSQNDRDGVTFGPGLELRKSVAAGAVAVLKARMAGMLQVQVPARAPAAGQERLSDEKKFRTPTQFA